ncbi:hypothetical protein DXG01_010249 [Tephrocybe rancida]|nr:hypothetical protein DXG01_010249 [Tephrocybe rancida]
MQIIRIVHVMSLLMGLTLVQASGTPLTQVQATSKLTQNNITAYSSGNCTDKTVRTCTSYDGILSGTVDGVITLKNASGVNSLIITGGTETGHTGGTYSHANGYKVDVRHDQKLDAYIKAPSLRSRTVEMAIRNGGRRVGICTVTKALIGISRTSETPELVPAALRCAYL